MALSHIFSSPIPDGTNTQLIRPSNWNSVHNEYMTLGGNTAGVSTLSGTNIVYQGGNNITLSGTGQTIVFNAPDVSQYLTTAMQSNAGIDALSDVSLSTPVAGQYLKFNGANWVNAAGSSSGAGSGVDLFFSSVASGIGAYETASQSPDSGVEVDESIVINNQTSAFEAYVTDVLGRTQIDAGLWDFSVYAYATPSQNTTTLDFNVYSRTSGGTETLLFSVSTTDIDADTVALYEVQTVQQAFTINDTDRLVIKVTATTNNTADTTVHFVHSGTTHYSHIHTPLITLHNSVAGLQGGQADQYYHFNAADYGFRNTTATSYYAVSNHSHGNPTLALTNLSGTTGSNSNGLTISLSANVGGGAGDGYNILAAGSQTAGTANTIQFANSNGITFGMSASSQITASHNGLTTAMASNAGSNFMGLNSAITQNGVSMTANSSGLSLNFPAFLTTAAQSGHSHGNPTLALTNITGTTASASNGLTISLSGNAAQTVQPVAVSGSNGSFVFSTLSFGNLNGLSFYTSNGSLVGSYTDGGGAGGGVAISAGTNSTGAGTVVFGSSAGNVTFGMATDGYVTASAPAGGGGANTLSNWRNQDLANNVSFSTFGQNSVYVQHFIPEDVLQFQNFEIYARGTFVSSSNSKVYAQTISYGLYSQDTGTNATRMTLIGSSSIKFSASYNSSTAVGFTISQGAGSYTLTSNNTNVLTNISGAFHQYLPFTTTIQPNIKHAVGMLISSATTVATGPWAFAPLVQSNVSSAFGRIYVSTIASASSSVIGDREMGIYGTTSGALPVSYATSQLGIAPNRANLYVQFE